MLHGGDRDFTANFTSRLDCWILQLLDISWLRPDNGPWHMELQQWGATGRCGCGQDLLWEKRLRWLDMGHHLAHWPLISKLQPLIWWKIRKGLQKPLDLHWFQVYLPSLMGGLESWDFMTFHSLGNNNRPNWRTPSFFKMGKLHHQPAVNSNFEKLDRMISGVFSR